MRRDKIMSRHTAFEAEGETRYDGRLRILEFGGVHLRNGFRTALPLSNSYEEMTSYFKMQ
jgi:hypothetical protein